MKLYLKMGIAILSIYILTMAVVYLLQDKLIFQSTKLSSNYEFNFNQPFNEYTLKTADNEQLNLLLFKTNISQARGIIIYFHGNAGNLNRWGKYAVDFTSLRYDVLMVEYRGYGKSTGTPTEEVLYSDSKFIMKSWKNF
ncbi:MAG: alpha/beta hydrolase [Bacteroidales bacterium]|nr:alpha/beta hydrolase [Bacteroidales bacterium]